MNSLKSLTPGQRRGRPTSDTEIRSKVINSLPQTELWQTLKQFCLQQDLPYYTLSLNEKTKIKSAATLQDNEDDCSFLCSPVKQGGCDSDLATAKG